MVDPFHAILSFIVNKLLAQKGSMHGKLIKYETVGIFQGPTSLYWVLTWY